jgi:PAS domain S-box-containing protein
MKLQYNHFIITVKSFLAVVVFAIPMYMFIKNSYDLNIESYIVNELKLQKALHLNNKYDDMLIASSKHFRVNLQGNKFLEDTQFSYFKKYFSKEQIKDIHLELSLKDTFSKAIKVKKNWYIVTFLYTKKKAQEYHVSITEAIDIDRSEQLLHRLQTMIIISSFVLFILSYILLLSRENLDKSKKEIEYSLDEANMYFNNAMIAFLIVDKNRNIISVNPLLCKIFGYTQEELLFQSAEILHVSPESYQAWGRLVFEKAQLNSVINEKYQVKRKNGELFWMEASGAPFDNTKKVSNGVVWTIMDVTEQMKNKETIDRLNQSIHENLSYLRLFLDTAPIPIYVNNKDGVIIECNNAFAKVIMKQKKEIVNHKLENFLPDSLLQIHLRKDKELLYNESVYYKEIFGTNFHESKIYEYHKTAIHKNDKYDGYICVMVDVTEHEEQETKLQKLIFEAVEKNRELTKAHEEERLNDIKFTAIGQLSAGITHEINTPLTYLKGNLEMLTMDLQGIPDSCKSKEQLIEDTIDMQNGINRIASIVEAMREMSQNKRVVLESTDIYATLITSLVISYNRSKQVSKIYLNDKLFTLDMQKEHGICFAMIQAQRVEQVWIIIINNALDQLQKIENYDEREIRINCFTKNKKVHIEFKDNAGGINVDMMETIFEPFVSDKPEGGMGVGLSIAKRIISEQNATICAYNDSDNAIFEVVFEEVESSKILH